MTNITITKEHLEKGFIAYGGRQLRIDQLKLGDTVHIPYKEDDPDGIKQHEAGAKLDAGKADCSLLLMFGKALVYVAKVGTFGARKYSRGGWQSVVGGLERYTAALLRHLFAEQYEDHDTDSELLHAGQVAWNSLARLELILRERDGAGTK